MGDRVPLPVPEPDPDEIRRVAREVVPGAPEPVRDDLNVVERFLQRIGDWIGDLVGGFTAGGGASAVSWLALAAIVGLLAWLAWRGLRSLEPRPRREPAPAGAPSAPVDWTAEARRFEADGRLRDALRCWYRAVLDALVGRGVLDGVPGEPGGRLRAEVGERAPGLSADFDRATRAFEDVWYGDAEPTDDDVRDVRRLAETTGAAS